jgi:hypothetical protein
MLTFFIGSKWAGTYQADVPPKSKRFAAKASPGSALDAAMQLVCNRSVPGTEQRAPAALPELD